MNPGPISQSIKFFQRRLALFWAFGACVALTIFPFALGSWGLEGEVPAAPTWAWVPYGLAIIFSSFAIMLAAERGRAGLRDVGFFGTFREAVLGLPKAFSPVVLGIVALVVCYAPFAFYVLPQFSAWAAAHPDLGLASLIVATSLKALFAFLPIVVLGGATYAGALRARFGLGLKPSLVRAFRGMSRKLPRIFIVFYLWFFMLGGLALVLVMSFVGPASTALFSAAVSDMVQWAVSTPFIAALALGGTSYFVFSDKTQADAVN